MHMDEEISIVFQLVMVNYARVVGHEFVYAPSILATSAAVPPLVRFIFSPWVKSRNCPVSPTTLR